MITDITKTRATTTHRAHLRQAHILIIRQLMCPPIDRPILTTVRKSAIRAATQATIECGLQYK